MILYRNILYCGILCALFLLACKKEKSRETPAETTTCDYAPYTTGSSFTYENVDSLGDSSSYTLNVTGDTVLNGVTYKKLANGDTVTYAMCMDGSYYQFVPSVSIDGYQTDSLLSLYLKDNAPLGSSWTDTISVTLSGTAVQGLLQYSITQKGISKTVYGKPYADVIAVKMDAAAIVLGTAMPIGTISTNYYARGVGLIEADLQNDTTRLKDYVIQ